MTDRVDGHTSLPGLQDKEVFYKSHLSGVSVIREGEEVRVVLRGTDFFEQGRTELSPGGTDYLFEIAELMHLSQGPVEVIGFADAEEPSGVEGFSFSARRAASVAAYFINNTGIAPGRFSVTGKGEYSPEVPATTEHADESNRRVEIVIHTGQ
ncbi:MAG: OmpA family protein [Proteobacteria bacterium]|nr:OmpA family protein [Pseudomonadota bacterium]MBU1610626.1 OmpA family protein [Pseudomonadota bacterium]